MKINAMKDWSESLLKVLNVPELKFTFKALKT